MFKCWVIATLKKLDERTTRMSEQIDTLVKELRAALTDVGSALDNIAADEQRLADQITALTKQVADLIAAGGTLGNAEFDKLVAFRNDLVTTAAKTKAIADAVPEPAPAG